MTRLGTMLLVVCMLALMPLVEVSSQEIVNGKAGFPEDIAVQPLGAGELDSAITAPSTLLLERVVLPPRGGVESRTVEAAELLYVESGTLRLIDGLGLTSTVEGGSGAQLRAGATYSARNGGSGDVSFLRLSLTAEGSAATPAVPQMATPVVEDGSAGVVVTALAELFLPEIPEAPMTLFLDRATWKSGVDSGPYTQNGPIGMLVESGTLTISSPSGIDGELSEGNPVLLPADQELRTRNDGDSDAVALLFGVIPSGSEAVSAVPPTPTLLPTAASEPTETSLPTAEPTATAEPTPEPTATPLPAAGTVLYEADTSGGFEEWPNSGGWQTVSGMLVNDGSSEISSFMPAPYQVGLPDYAVEVEMQWIREGETFGIVVRGVDDGGYWIGGTSSCASGRWLVVWGGPAQALGCPGRERNALPESFIDFGIDNQWHTYRIEVRGNLIRVSVDGTLLLETSDNRYLSSGQVGVWSQGAQVNIRRFSVIALGVAGQGAPSTTSASGSESNAQAIEPARVDVLSLLPGAADLPAGLVETGRRSRTLPDVADNYTDTAETTQLFTEWGWQGNAVASFVLPPGQDVRNGEVNGVYVSSHRFASAEGARSALEFSLTEQAAGTSLQEVTAPQLGEYTRVLSGTMEHGTEITS